MAAKPREQRGEKEMNELQIFENEQFGNLKAIEKQLKDTYKGVVYAVEYGNNIKIGYTTKPYSRYVTLKRNAEKYGAQRLGRICISECHTNYRENEKILHQYFLNFRVPETELFSITLEKFKSEYANVKLIFKDETNEITKRSEEFCEGMKKLIFGGIFK